MDVRVQTWFYKEWIGRAQVFKVGCVVCATVVACNDGVLLDGR